MEMRERLKDNPQQMQQEMMRIYREEKVNPMGGCFPILIQIPVFIALVLGAACASVEMRNAPWMLWIHDLSSPDPLLHPAVVDDVDHPAANRAKPCATGPDAGQDDVVHAVGLQRHVLLLPSPVWCCTGSPTTFCPSPSSGSSTPAWACHRSSTCPSSSQKAAQRLRAPCCHVTLTPSAAIATALAAAVRWASCASSGKSLGAFRRRRLLGKALRPREATILPFP